MLATGAGSRKFGGVNEADSESSDAEEIEIQSAENNSQGIRVWS